MSRSARPVRPVAELVLASLWGGATAIVATTVAPAAFAVLPSRAQAGLLIGRILPVLFLSGAALGIAVVAAELTGRAAGLARAATRAVAGAVIFVACAVAQFVVGPQIARARAAIPGVIEALAATDPRRIEFGRLHALSVAWLGLATLAALVIVVLAAREALTTRS